MTELEQRLQALGGELEWPETPALGLRLAPPRRRLHPGWAAVALAVVAGAVALSIPSARSALLRVFHLGGVTVERVNVRPRARAVPLGRYLGPVVGARVARQVLGRPLRLPPALHPGELHMTGAVVSVLLRAPRPMLLSELPSDVYLLKKIAVTSTHLEGVSVDGQPGFWITGAKHVILFPDAPPRLAGNVLVWQRGSITYRLEAPDLTLARARRVAAEVGGTS
jgi:hypothetical protein